MLSLAASWSCCTLQPRPSPAIQGPSSPLATTDPPPTFVCMLAESSVLPWGCSSAMTAMALPMRSSRFSPARQAEANM